jgi:hypothetical protein
VIDRRQAVLGYVTYRLGRRIVKRRLRRTGGATRSGHADGGQSMKQAKNALNTARAVALVETVRPIVTRAMNDPELHDALRQAFSTGMDVKDEISGKKPSKAARKLANDKKLHRRVETSAQDLQKAVSGLVEPTKKKGGFKRFVGRIAIVGAVAGGVVVVLKKLKRGGDEPTY